MPNFLLNKLTAKNSLTPATRTASTWMNPGGEIKQKLPKWHAALFGPEIPAGVGDRGERQMDEPFMGPQPAELLLISHLALDASRISHDLLELQPSQAFGIKSCSPADQLVGPVS